MIFLNKSIGQSIKLLENRKIVFFGCGSWLSAIEGTQLMTLKNNFSFVIDNETKKYTKIGDIELEVYSPEVLLKIDNCAIILTSPVYMFDMYCQLQKMNLSDEIICCAFPFMQMAEKNTINIEMRDKAINKEGLRKIPKIIHCFWFGGEGKPSEYQRCVDSWKNTLDDYEIKEWNLNNYNWHKNKFLEKAIECKAWAFASDYARLDVLNEFGGIYMDMDVEVFKPFDDLLHNDAILSFSNNIMVDLAVLGSGINNSLINQILKLYDFVEVPLKREDFSKFFQPTFVRKTLIENGVEMNGKLQFIENATIFPKDFFMPLDHILFRGFERTADTYCVHYDNFGWSYGTENKRMKKIQDNNKLWNLIS